MNPVETEAVKLGAFLLSLEKWSKTYSEAPDQHAKLIKAQSQLTVALVKFFKGMSAKAGDFINKEHYNYQLAQIKQQKLSREELAVNVNVIVNDDQIGQEGQTFMKLVFNPINTMVATGHAAAQEINNIPLGVHSTDQQIQNLTTERVANLVGKQVTKTQVGEKTLPSGKKIPVYQITDIKDNPNAEFNILDTVRNDIAASVQSSLLLGETTDEATARVADAIDQDGYRAQRIANTETVNAYNQGVMQFGQDTDAKGKEWETAGATDECADNAAEGIINMDDSFSSGDDAPPAHPNCLCAVRLVYQSELDANSGDSSSDESDS